MKLALSLLCAALVATGAPRWEVQYFHDEPKSSLALTDIVFPSAQRGIASGFLVQDGRTKPVVLVTTNGGAAWTHVQVKEAGHALYCLDEASCWMVGDSGLWYSDEAGRTWKRIKKERGIRGVYFLTREHGWMYGAEKKLLETKDAGKTWKQVQAATDLKTSPERTVFYAMTFITPRAGILSGRSEPVVSRRELPIWAESDPEDRKERPAMSIFLDTKDTGVTWNPSSASMFGRFSRLSRPGLKGAALGLVEFDRFFTYPSEVYKYDFANGNLERAFRKQDVAITDVGMTPKGEGVIGGFEPPGRLARTPVPGRVRLFLSDDYKSWTETAVDYRAVATRLRLAVVDDSHMWAATDTGMILRLVR